MNGKTYAYLDLVALPAVGALLLDQRPAFVFPVDGSRVLFANAAGMEFFGEASMGGLLARRPAPGSALARQIVRLAKMLPADGQRLEMLRFNLDGRQVALPAACRRLNLADGSRAVAAVGAVDTLRESIATRAERLADAIAAEDCLVALLRDDGRVLGASGGFSDLAPASAEIDALIEAVADSSECVVKRPVEIGAATRPAGIARFEAGGEVLFLLIVGPEETRPVAKLSRPLLTSIADVVVTFSRDATADAIPAKTATVPLAEPAAAITNGPVAAVAAAGPPVAATPTAPTAEEKPLPEPTSDASAPPAAGLPDVSGAADASGAMAGDAGEMPPSAEAMRATLRFLWQVDADQRFTFVSPHLGEAVGAGNAAIVGRTWCEISNDLGLDPEARVGEALATRGTWAGVTVHWPVAAKPERVAVDLSALPVFARDRRFAGFRGFGIVRLDDRQADVRPPQPVNAEGAHALLPNEPVPPAPIPPAPTPARAAPPLAFSEADIDDAARRSIEEGGRLAAARRDQPPAEPEAPQKRASAEILPGPGPARPAGSNVVRLPGAPVRAFPPERLSGTEQDAFRRIAEALGVKMTDDNGRHAGAAKRPADDGAESGQAPAGQPAGNNVDARLLDKLPVGIVIYRDRKALFANRALLDLLGYESAADFAASGGAEAIFPDRDGNWARPAVPGEGALSARRRDGGRLPVEARLHAVQWGSGAALMLSLVKRSEARKDSRADETLLGSLVEAERRIDELQAILDTATDGIVVVDGQGRIDTINQSAEALFGIEASEVLKRPFTELLAEESRKAALDYLDGLAENGVASVLNDGREVIGKVPRGGLIPLFMTMGRLADGSKFCAVLRDITHWKNVEEELIAAKRAAETANAQKSEFLAKISHEIRTPLNAIIGFSEVMMEARFGPIANDRYRDYLRDIHVSGTHMLSLINDLLDLSKIEAGKLDLAFESVAVNEVIQECVALMQPQANRQRIIIRTSLSAGVPNVVADQRSLRQILLNLLSNAIKFTAAGGQVIVATGLEDNGEVVLRIRDTGIGMSEKEIETAMKPFRQVAIAGRGRQEGTGLGLPLTKALVEANRATFSIDSAPNQGTLVKVTFPMTRVLAG
jgi:PAS domain S-box-containing protein